MVALSPFTYVMELAVHRGLIILRHNEVQDELFTSYYEPSNLTVYAYNPYYKRATADHTMRYIRGGDYWIQDVMYSYINLKNAGREICLVGKYERKNSTIQPQYNHSNLNHSNLNHANLNHINSISVNSTNIKHKSLHDSYDYRLLKNMMLWYSHNPQDS